MPPLLLSDEKEAPEIDFLMTSDYRRMKTINPDAYRERIDSLRRKASSSRHSVAERHTCRQILGELEEEI